MAAIVLTIWPGRTYSRKSKKLYCYAHAKAKNVEWHLAFSVSSNKAGTKNVASQHARSNNSSRRLQSVTDWFWSFKSTQKPGQFYGLERDNFCWCLAQSSSINLRLADWRRWATDKSGHQQKYVESSSADFVLGHGSRYYLVRQATRWGWVFRWKKRCSTKHLADRRDHRGHQWRVTGDRTSSADS